RPLRHRRVDEAGAERNRAHGAVELLVERARERDHRGLRRAVGGEPRRGQRAGNRREVDDPAARLAEERDRGLRDEKEAAQIDADLQVEVLPGQILDGAGDSDAGRVHEHVEPAVSLEVLGDGACALAGVGRDRRRAELGGRRLDLLGAPRDERQLEALLPQHAGDRQSDARRAAGDEGRAIHMCCLSGRQRGPKREHSRRGCLQRCSPLPRRRRLRPPSSYSVRVTALTGLTAGGGCAAKYSAARLDELLRGFVPVQAENLLVGLSPADDAAVYRLDDERALVFTLDFFPPLVDDPATFGRIAATNALNDVFAMGGTPLLALSIAAFPEELPTEVLGAIFAAAAEQVRAAGGILAGGHTIRDAEPKYGLAVVGTVHPDAVWPKSGAQPGDALFLTKPIGTGLVLAAKGDIAQAVELMTTLNAQAADVLRPFSPNAVTDVTGFGLFGHAHEMATRSGVRIAIDD